MLGKTDKTGLNEKDDYQSLSYHAWQHFKQNKLAIVSLFYICFCLFVAILGYLITPDASPDANDQKLELSTKPPGFTVQMLLIHKNQPSQKKGIFHKMIYGEYSNWRSVPILSYRFEDNDIIYEEYRDGRSKRETEKRVNLADVIYPLQSDSLLEFNISDNTISCYVMGSNKKITKTTQILQKEIIENNIVTQKYILGTDIVGRDLLSRIMIGTRISFSVGFTAVTLSIFVGILLGALAGYFRGFVDDMIMWLINVIWSVPTLLLVIAISLVLGKGFWQMFIAVGLTMWIEVARVIRGKFMSVREKEYIEAGRALGFSKTRLIFKHILPNVMGPVIIIAATNFAAAILIEAGLSFLGVGAQPPTPSWGSMISAHRGFIIGDSPYLAFLPGIAIMLLVLSFVLVGNGLRDALDTKFVDDDNAIV